MMNMFVDCHSLTSINFGNNFKTETVTQMDSMFMNCANITSLDLSLFGTSLVFDMSSMFEGCSSLKVLDISNFNMTKVAAPEGEYGFFLQMLRI